ncbi:MAG: phosphotransferase [Clostridia bacterium]|nr:phosphotransferase [Bacilli bacterium]MBR3324787.1 phosphotransferase [Clostridia bacterium]
MEYKLANQIAKRKTKQVFRDRDSTIKLFVKKYSKAAILNEALNLARVEEGTDLNIPKLKEVTMIDDRWGLVIEYIEGYSLAELMDDNPDKIDEYLELFVKIQLEIFSKKVPLLNKIKDKYNRKITETDLIDEDVKYNLLHKLDGLKNRSKLCHGDFMPSNVIITDSGKYYIIDWAHVTRGNESADAAKTYLTLKLNKKDDLAEKYMNLFCKKTDISKKDIQDWIPIVAAAEITKGDKSEYKFLSQWINVADYE